MPKTKMYREISSPPSPSAEPKFPGKFRTRPHAPIPGDFSYRGWGETPRVVPAFRVGPGPWKGRAGGAFSLLHAPQMTKTPHFLQQTIPRR